MKCSVVLFIFVHFIASYAKAASPRIVGGAIVSLGQIPSQVSLRTQTNAHFCGGCLIAGRWVITSAQCTSGRGQNSITIVAGTIALNAGGVSQQSQRIVQHPQFHSLSLANDVALIQTVVDFVMTQNVQTINLGIANLGAGVSLQLSGWGATQTSGPLSNNLQRLNTLTITNALCASRLLHQNLQVTETKLCTHTRAGQGVCSGDQGGPVIDMNNQLVAVKSWFISCAVDFPDGHERISSHRQWILSVIS